MGEYWQLLGNTDKNKHIAKLRTVHRLSPGVVPYDSESEENFEINMAVV